MPSAARSSKPVAAISKSGANHSAAEPPQSSRHTPCVVTGLVVKRYHRVGDGTRSVPATLSQALSAPRSGAFSFGIKSCRGNMICGVNNTASATRALPAMNLMAGQPRPSDGGPGALARPKQMEGRAPSPVLNPAPLGRRSICTQRSEHEAVFRFCRARAPGPPLHDFASAGRGRPALPYATSLSHPAA